MEVFMTIGFTKAAALITALSMFWSPFWYPFLLRRNAQKAASTEEQSEEAAAPAKEFPAEKTERESALNLANMGAEWTYSDSANAWILSVVTAVTNAELPDYQGVSVCVPAAYVKGIDTDADGAEDVTAQTVNGTVTGVPVIDYDAEIVSTNGQTYTAATAPVIVNTGAAGYSAQSNQQAGTTYAAEGYVNVACGNRGKQSSITDEDGNTIYTGDAPSCLVDQKNAVRFVKYNMLLGYLPGDVNRFVSTGGSGGGAHAAMLAATSDNPDFYAYENEAGAVGVCRYEDGEWCTSVTVNGEEVELSDGMWGCMAYSAITSLAEADMALAFEYTLDATYSFGSAFQKQTAAYLAEKYMEYINEKGLTVEEAKVGFDLDKDGKLESTVALTVQYDPNGHADTNGYYGTYLDFYLAEFKESLNDYLERLDYAEGWTWFDEEGNALSDEAVTALTTADKAAAFLEGRYAKSSSGGMGGPGSGAPGEDGGRGTPPDGMSGGPGGDFDAAVGPPDMNGAPEVVGSESDAAEEAMTADTQEVTEEVGTPDAGTTQSATGKTDSANYSSFAEMLAAYQADIAEIEAGDLFGNNIVDLYNPIRYIGAEGTRNPAWARILMGASEGDISMFNSLNLEIAWLKAGTDAEIEWQWDGGHVPSEILGDSFALYVDTMYAKCTDGAAEVTKAAAEKQTANGTAEAATGTDLSGWVSYDAESGVSFALSDAAAYRTAGASKAIPGFDVMDYGQEDYVFGSATADARHWNSVVAEVFAEHTDDLADLFNSGK